MISAYNSEGFSTDLSVDVQECVCWYACSGYCERAGVDCCEVVYDISQFRLEIKEPELVGVD